MISIFVGDRAYSSSRRKLEIDGKELESKSHILRIRPVRRLTLLSTFPFSMNLYMHSLERSARTRFQPGERPSLTSSPRRGEAFRRVWSARTTCEACYKTFPSGSFLRRALLHTLRTRRNIFQRGDLGARISGRSGVSSILCHHVFRPTTSARLVPSCTIVITLTINRSWLGRTFLSSIHRLAGCCGAVNTSLFFV